MIRLHALRQPQFARGINELKTYFVLDTVQPVL